MIIKNIKYKKIKKKSESYYFLIKIIVVIILMHILFGEILFFINKNWKYVIFKEYKNQTNYTNKTKYANYINQKNISEIIEEYLFPIPKKFDNDKNEERNRFRGIFIVKNNAKRPKCFFIFRSKKYIIK